MKKIAIFLALAMMCSFRLAEARNLDRAPSSAQMAAAPVAVYLADESVPIKPPVPIVNVIEEEEEEKEPDISEEEIELLALLTMAEAEGEPEEGQRLVIDTVLNRVDCDKEFPDTISEVIYQKNQFSSMWNGRVDRCCVQEELVELVREELKDRTNFDVIFFRTGRYSQYGTPLFQVGNHYFSSYD